MAAESITLLVGRGLVIDCWSRNVFVFNFEEGLQRVRLQCLLCAEHNACQSLQIETSTSTETQQQQQQLNAAWLI